jgi:Ni/Fe-hydrogenase subunit HybB-like protein
MAESARSLSHPLTRPEEQEEDPKEHLLLDPLPRGEMNRLVMESMHTTSWKFWVVVVVLAGFVVYSIIGLWGYMIAEGLGVTGVNRTENWAIFLTNVVFWIGISHAGTFVSALLRVVKAEFRRPFTRMAELMTTFGLVEAGFSVFMHMGRAWLAYWLFPYPNERTIWPDFHSPLMWDFLAISTYLLASSMYVFLPLIPDLAMARDRSTGWRKVFYRTLSFGFRGSESEWTHLKTAMNLFAYAILPVMFSVHTIVAWDFAMATRPGWSSTIFGPYFVVGALHSGLAAVAVILFVISRTMKNMKYFIRPEHFDGIGKLMLMITMTWGYFFFNDYLVEWYGGESISRTLQKFLETGPQNWIFFLMLACNFLIPMLFLWNRKFRRNPTAMVTMGIIINIGMWLERYVIIPVGLTINRMPFTWRVYVPRIEIYMTLGTFSLFILMYLIMSRLIPFVPVWEVQEGQMAHSLRKFGKTHVASKAEIE